jgi:spore maturation protein CgeB
MRLVVFGLSISSSFGSRHATSWRGLCRALHELGHHVVFFERDAPSHSIYRDVEQPDYCDLFLYRHWVDALPAATRALAAADVGILTSECPDAALVADLIAASRAPIRALYDLDPPRTIARVARGEPIEHLGTQGLGVYDVVLSAAGGPVLDDLRRLGARRAVTLPVCVDPLVHRPVAPCKGLRGDLSYLGVFHAERGDRLEQLFVEPARRLPNRRFVLGGAHYPTNFPWRANIWYAQHVPPASHAQFYCSSPLTLNVSRDDARMRGWCPSERIFEAAACGVAVLTDPWPGLASFFEPGREILVADSPEAVVDALRLPAVELARIGAAARARVLAEHDCVRRAHELTAMLCLTASELRAPHPRDLGTQAKS